MNPVATADAPPAALHGGPFPARKGPPLAKSPAILEARAWFRLADSLTVPGHPLRVGTLCSFGVDNTPFIEQLALAGVDGARRCLHARGAPGARTVGNLERQPYALWLFSDLKHGRQFLFQGQARCLDGRWTLRVEALTVALREAADDRRSWRWDYRPAARAPGGFDPMTTLL